MSVRLGLGLSFAAALLAGGVFAGPAAAERIVLRNGRDIKECWILEEDKAQLVVAIIRRGNIGKITIDAREVESIDHTRETTLEEALAKARSAMEEEARRVAAEKERAAAAAAVSLTAQPKGDGKKGANGEGGKGGDLIPPTTPDEEAQIAEAIKGIGDTRRAGGESTRRENALKALTGFGLKAIPATTVALEDDVSYRRMNAARALAEIAQQDRRLEIYQDAVPKLIKLLYDPQPWVRVAADRALQAISGQNVGFPEPKAEDLSNEETAAIDRWAKWWDEQRSLLTGK